MKILLIHPQKEVGDLLAFPLESKFSARVFCAVSADQGRDYLITQKMVPDLVVAQNTQETTSLLSTLFKEAALEPNLVLCDGAHVSGASYPGAKLWGFAGKTNLLAELEGLIAKNRGEQKVEKAGDDDKYCRINTALLLKMNPLSADIFIRLSATHYIKMFQKDDTFDANDLARYRDQKKVDYLYLLNGDCPIFIKRLSDELSQMLASREPPPPKTLNETISNTLETTHELIAKFGVTEEVQKVMKDSVALTMKAMGDFPQLGDILKNIQNHGGKYIGHHSTLLGSIACSLAVCMEWVSESTFEKLTLAAFLHDAALRDHELCAVKSLDEFDKKYKGKFSLAQVQEYKAHPQRAVLMLGSFKDAPGETDKIILQHHEHPMGSGFPDGLTSNYISPLGALFIIAHDLTDYVIDHGKADMEDFLVENQNKYSQGNFKKIARAIASVTL